MSKADTVMTRPFEWVGGGGGGGGEVFDLGGWIGG